MKRILVVEDDVLQAFDLADFLTTTGYVVRGPARKVHEALALIDTGCDAAIIDVNLGGETSASVLLALNERKIPVIAVSGYTAQGMPPGFAHAIKLAKPLDRSELERHLRQLLAD